MGRNPIANHLTRFWTCTLVSFWPHSWSNKKTCIRSSEHEVFPRPSFTPEQIDAFHKVTCQFRESSRIYLHAKALVPCQKLNLLSVTFKSLNSKGLFEAFSAVRCQNIPRTIQKFSRSVGVTVVFSLTLQNASNKMQQHFCCPFMVSYSSFPGSFKLPQVAFSTGPPHPVSNSTMSRDRSPSRSLGEVVF